MKKEKILLYAFLFFLGAAIIGTLLMWLPKLWKFDGSSDGWLGYWGGVIGALFGVIGAYLVMNEQIKYEEEQKKLEKEPLIVPWSATSRLAGRLCNVILLPLTFTTISTTCF